MPNFNSYPRYVNLDDDLRTLNAEAARYMLNARGYSSSESEAQSLENLKSTLQVLYAEASGENLVVGSIKHEEKNDIYIFVWNSNKAHRILRYNTITDSIEIVLENSLLGFTKTCHVQGFAITSQNPSDTLLHWTDGVTQPKEINVTRARFHTNGNYTNGYQFPLTMEMIKYIKYPPINAPTFVHGKDPSVVYNNLSDNVFQFRYRYVHKDGQRTAYSAASSASFSEYQLRNGVFQSQNADLVYNYVDITVDNTWNDIDKIEIIAKNVASTEWVLIKTLDNVTNGQLQQTYRFFNDDVYNAVDEFDANKSYDAVPIKAVALEYILNRAIFGNAVDGYNNIDQEELDSKMTLGVKFSKRQGISSIPISYTESFELNPPSNKLVVTFDTSGLSVNSGDVFYLDFSIRATVNLAISVGVFYETYTASVGETISDVVNGLALLFFQNQNNNVICTDQINSGNDLVLKFQLKPYFRVSDSSPIVTLNNSTQVLEYQAVPTFKSGAKHPIGIEYLDDSNRNGSIQKKSENSPYVQFFSGRQNDFKRGKASIDVRVGYKPPLWASHYRIVYGGNKSIGDFLQYTVTKAYINKNTVSKDGDKNIYIPINTFKGGLDDDAHSDAYKTSTGALPDYQFKEGDRIRIISYVPQGSTNGESDRIYTDEYLDFKVVGYQYYEKDVSTSPIYNNGKNAYGWTLVIEDPNRDDAWSWDYIRSNGDSDTNWFVKNSSNGHGSSALIEIYSTKDRNVDDVYYETSFKFDIDSAGLPTRRHRGQRNQDELYTLLFSNIALIDTSLNRITYSSSSFNLFIGDVINFEGGTASPSGDYTVVDIIENDTIPDAYDVYFNETFDSTTPLEIGDTVLKELYAAIRVDEGDVWLKPRKLITGTLDNNATTERTIFYDVVEDYYANDFFESAAWACKGRVQAYSEYAKQEDRKAAVWLSEPYFPSNNTNGLSAFNLSNADTPLKEYDRSLGGIQALVRNGDNLRMYQENKCSLIKVGKDTLTTGDGGTLITLTSRVLSDQVPLKGDYGISMNPESLASKDGNDYFLDIKRGKVLRWAADGLTPISDYKISKLLDKVSQEYMSIVNSAGFKAYGGFDREHDEYNLTFDEVIVQNISVDGNNNPYDTPNVSSDVTNITVQASVLASDVPREMIVIDEEDVFADIVNFETVSTDSIVYLNTETIEEGIETIPVGVTMQDIILDGSYDFTLSQLTLPLENGDNTLTPTPVKTVEPLTISFHEASNTWCGERSYTPNGYENVGYTLLSFKNGTVWKHDRGTSYNTFYGVPAETKVNVVFPQSPSENKVFNSVSTESNIPFEVDSAATNLTDTFFAKERFEEREGIWYSDITRATSTVSNTNSNLYGIGTIASQNGNNIVFNEKINELGIAIGNLLINSVGNLQFGSVISIVDEYTIEVANNMAINVGDFVYGVKNSSVEGDACRGVYLKLNLRTDSTEFVELFSANTNVNASNLTLTQK